MRFLIRFYLWGLLLSGAGLGGLFAATPYARLAAAVAQPNFGLVGGAPTLALTPGRLLALRLALLGTAAVAAAGLLLVKKTGVSGRSRRLAYSRQAHRSLIRRAARYLVHTWQALAPAKRAVAAALLLAVAAARLYYAAYYPLSLDEIASYDYSVLPGAAVTASYYPFPNNHLLPNLLVGLLHTLVPAAPPALALRLLPTLAGLLALPLLYAGAMRALRFGVATLALGWFWLSPLGVYYAVAGRGYAWALLAALAGLAAATALLRPGGLQPAARHGAWAAFGASAVLGLYAVPTHLYAVLALGLGLLVGFGRQPGRQRAANLRRLALSAAGIGAVTGLLYAPVGAVSGWDALLANRYVAQLPLGEFWAGIGPWLVGTASELLGQRGASAAAYALLLLAAPLALLLGRLPGVARRLGWLLFAQYTLWLPVVLAQRVNPPARTLLLVLLAFFGLLALCIQALLNRLPVATGPARRGLARPALVLALLAYGGYRLRREQVIINRLAAQQTELHQAYYWLRRQPLRRIWVEPREYAIFWQHYALANGERPLPLVVVDDALATLPGPVGEVEVLRAAPDPARPGQLLRYNSGAVAVLPVGPGLPRVVVP